MVALKSLVTFAGLAVFSATAAPAPGPSPVPSENPLVPVAEHLLEARQDQGCVKLCGDHFFQGQCYVFCTGNNQCANLGGGFNDWVSSLEVTSWPQWTCTYYEHAGCSGASFTSNYDDTLHDSGGWWADKISSIRCFRRCDASNPFC